MPSGVRALLDGEPVRLVWENPLGGRTYQVGDGPGGRYLKLAPPGSGLDLAAEAATATWAEPFHPVPQVLGHGADESGAWLLTAALPGQSAVAARWIAEPAVAVPAIGVALRALHDALPVDSCPFSWSVAERLADARRRADRGELDRSAWDPAHQSMTVAEALGRASDAPPIDRLVVCHGDACAPNTLLADDGRWTGHVDVGALGLADRWADLAVATWSVTWNFGPGWERQMLDAYGVEWDDERIAYYRLLWDLG
jgi:kanamycin kinase